MYHVGIDVLCLSVLLVLYYFSPSCSVFAVRKFDISTADIEKMHQIMLFIS